MKSFLSVLGVSASFLVMVLVLYMNGCKKRNSDDPAFYAQLSNSHIKGCRATAKHVSNLDSERSSAVWTVRCRDHSDYACSLTRGADDETRVTCTLQSVPLVRERSNLDP